MYINGIGSEDGITRTDRYLEGFSGSKCMEQIRSVYRACCRLSSPQDEVWLYGFSRGAWVVQAVAGLLHYIRALSSADLPGDEDFVKEYEQALGIYRKMQKNSKLASGQVRKRTLVMHPLPPPPPP
jgi:uncharacterized protein (DUF2235 family)